MIVLKSGHHVDAVTVIEDAGFVDITSDVSTATHKFFEKDGKLFMRRNTGRMSRWCR